MIEMPANVTFCFHIFLYNYISICMCTLSKFHSDHAKILYVDNIEREIGIIGLYYLSICASLYDLDSKPRILCVL